MLHVLNELNRLSTGRLPIWMYACVVPQSDLKIYPHTSFAEEVDFLQAMFAGSAYVHGPLSSDHWYTYVADDCRPATSVTADRTLNLMMYGLEAGVAQNFYKSDEVGQVEPNSRAIVEPCGTYDRCMQTASPCCALRVLIGYSLSFCATGCVPVAATLKA